MTVLHNEDRWDASNVSFADGRILAYDKRRRTPEMKHIDYGLGVLAANALDPYPADAPFDLAEVYQDLAARGALAAYEVGSRFYEIGTPRGLEETRAHLAARKEKA
jgi:NDP-sugar pyrophosphorylase family protein